MRSRLIRAIFAAAAFLLLPASGVLAHPLGNFTINRYDGLTLSVDGVVVDHVLDMAEIPALQERQRMDGDGDGTVSDAEGATWAEATCRATASQLLLQVTGRTVGLEPTAIGLSFPPGQAGLVILRLVCTYNGAFPAVTGATDVTFRDRTYEGRLGWREIVVSGDGVALSGAESFAEGASQRLKVYPAAQLATPRDQGEAAFSISPGGAPSPAAPIPDAVPLGSPPDEVVSEAGPAAALPGGIVELPREITDIIQAQGLTLPAIVLSMIVAAGVGAVHAASPGHGKTLMAAYLVGTRGTMRHALGLGLTVTLSHTVGVLVLGAVITFAGALLPSERLFPILGIASGILVVLMGLGLLFQRWREARQQRYLHASVSSGDHAHDDEHGHHHAHDDEHGHDHHEQQGERPPGPAPVPGTMAAAAVVAQNAVGGYHSHGLVRHTHLPQGEDPLRWRNLVALGLVGGLVPSASAILILVGSIAAGRPAYGMVLTLAFGLGMAVVLVGVGVLLVRARGFVERWPRADRLAPLMARLPLITAALFVVFGVVITVQAGAQLR